MPIDIHLIKVGMTMTEGTIAEWHVADGDEVAKGEPLYTLETEKVSLEVEAPGDGVVKHLYPAGTTLAPAAVIGHLYAPGEEVPAIVSGPVVVAEPLGDALPAAAPGSESRAAPAEPGAQPPDPSPAPAAAPAGEPPPASPLARRLAEQAGLDLRDLQGTGPGGRITKEDIERALAGRDAPPETSPTGAPGASSREGRRIAMSRMRKVIAARMHDSLQASAQLTMDMEVGVDEAIRLREALIEEWRADGIEPSYTDLVLKAVAKALMAHPGMNAEIDGDEIVLAPTVDLGLAVALPDGLVVPVIRGAETMSLKDLAAASSRLAELAREGRLGSDDLAGGTFTVTSLGMFAVDRFTPILNPPQVGILGVNRIREAVAWEGDRPVRRRVMNLSLTWDHRAVDGAPAAEFLVAVRDLLQAPHRLLV